MSFFMNSGNTIPFCIHLYCTVFEKFVVDKLCFYEFQGHRLEFYYFVIRV